jgi:segregation and condensation protein B
MGSDSTDTQTTPTAEETALPRSPEAAPAAESKPARRRSKADSSNPAPTAPSTAPTPEAVAAIAPSLEAALLSTDKPVQPTRLAIALGLITLDPETGEDAKTAAEHNDREGEVQTKKPSAASLKAARIAADAAAELIAAAVDRLNAEYESTGRSFRIESVAGGLRVMTLPAHAHVVAAMHRQRTTGRLSRASIETLAIIAYKQPITRAQLEAIRGVACGEVLRSLMERRLVTIRGRAEELGRPILYGTTKQFLDHFGLATLSDLPTLTELKPQ